MPPKRSLKLFFLRLKKINLLILFFLLFLFGLLFLNEYFRVKEVKIEADLPSLNFIGVEGFKNKNLLFISTKKEELKLKNVNPQIKDVSIIKKPPNSLIIKIKSYSPKALIKTNQGFFVLSEDGRILFTVKNLSNFSLLPLINYYQLVNQSVYFVGDWLDFNDIKITLTLLNKLEEFNLKIKNIDILNEDMILFKLKDGEEIVFTSKKNWEKQIFPIPLILKQFKIEGRNFKRIDVRFDKPIVKF